MILVHVYHIDAQWLISQLQIVGMNGIYIESNHVAEWSSFTKLSLPYLQLWGSAQGPLRSYGPVIFDLQLRQLLPQLQRAHHQQFHGFPTRHLQGTLATDMATSIVIGGKRMTLDTNYG